jgi:hypothetical protein
VEASFWRFFVLLEMPLSVDALFEMDGLVRLSETMVPAKLMEVFGACHAIPES